MVRILDENGEELALATLQTGETERLTLTIERVVQGKGRLFQHYFSKGRRTVHVETAVFFLTGTLGTRWLGTERLWFIKLAQAGSSLLDAPRRAPTHGGPVR